MPLFSPNLKKKGLGFDKKPRTPKHLGFVLPVAPKGSRPLVLPAGLRSVCIDITFVPIALRWAGEDGAIPTIDIPMSLKTLELVCFLDNEEIVNQVVDRILYKNLPTKLVFHLIMYGKRGKHGRDIRTLTSFFTVTAREFRRAQTREMTVRHHMDARSHLRWLWNMRSALNEVPETNRWSVDCFFKS